MRDFRRSFYFEQLSKTEKLCFYIVEAKFSCVSWNLFVTSWIIVILAGTRNYRDQLNSAHLFQSITRVVKEFLKKSEKDLILTFASNQVS